MKRNRNIFLVLLLIIAIFLPRELKTCADSEVDNLTDATGTYEYWLNADGTVAIMRYKGTESVVEIPTALDGRIVSEIGSEVFWGNSDVEKIIIPDSVTYIEWSAFSSCKKLKCLFISKNVSKIGYNFVYGCPELTEIIVDADNAYYSSVDGVLYNKDVTEIICVPEGLKMTKYDFPNSVVSIGDYAFCRNSYLTNIVIPNRIINVGKEAFAWCVNLKTVVLGKGVVSIKRETFSLCVALENVKVKGNLRRIGSRAFWCCYSLKKIMLPKGIKTIEVDALGCGRWVAPDGETHDASGLHIEGFSGTVAQRYAKKNRLYFKDVDTGKVIRYDLINIHWGYCNVLTDCNAKSVVVNVSLSRRIYPEITTVKPAGFEIYRAPIKKNGEKGTYQKIKTVKKVTHDKEKWRGSYKDRDVVLGKSYAYKVRGYKKIGNKKVYSSFSSVRKGACGSEIGQYKCEVIKSSWDKLIVKLTGEKKNKNGPLRLGKLINNQGVLVGKTSESGEEKYIYLLIKKISLDGEKWYNEEEKEFTIQKGESIYLLFRDDDENGHNDNPVGPDGRDDIGIQNYTHVQIMKRFIIYREKKVDLRLNLTAGKAEAGEFVHWNETGDYVTEWDGDEFSFEFSED